MEKIKIQEESASNATKKFEVGKMYFARPDRKTFEAIRITRRTAQTIWFIFETFWSKKEFRKKISLNSFTLEERIEMSRFDFDASNEFNEEAAQKCTEIFFGYDPQAYRDVLHVTAILKQLNGEEEPVKTASRSVDQPHWIEIRTINRIDISNTAIEPADEGEKVKPLSKTLTDIARSARRTLRTTLTKHLKEYGIEIIGQTGIRYGGNYASDFTKLDISVSYGNTLMIWDVEDWYQENVLAKYTNVKQFEYVIRDLVAAIKRGDETFTFPADNAC